MTLAKSIKTCKTRTSYLFVCFFYSSYLTPKYLNKHRVNVSGYVGMKNINYYPLLKNINMLDTDKLGYVGHLSLRTNIIYVDVIIWTSLNQLGKMRNLVYS